MINVTKTYLPDKKQFLSYVDKIYQNGWVTNNGPLVLELESRLKEYLGVRNIVLVANGTVALEVAYRLLGLKGTVITTPFSFVATTSSLVTSGLDVMFSDINPGTFNISAEGLEGVITEKTSAIVPVHVYGNVCDVSQIERVACRHKLKVIYDAAHAFGVRYKEESVLNYGDISTLSFHATKLFHAVEGGALIFNDDALEENARLLINFGIDGPDSVKSLGINAKMNEFEAAMGLCVLDDIDLIIESRRGTYQKYMGELSNSVEFQVSNPDGSQNYGYFPILLESSERVRNIQQALAKEGVSPRRYFYPSLDTLPYVKPGPEMVVSRDIANRVLCLPMYVGLSESEQDKIIACCK